MINLQKNFYSKRYIVNSSIFGFGRRGGRNYYEKSVRRSERWRKSKLSGMTNEEIEESFNKAVDMTVFSWNGDVDTIMSPIDSIDVTNIFLGEHDVHES